MVEGVARRTTNMNYLVIQSSPPEMARAAYDMASYFTVKCGIPCTVEKGSPKTHTNNGWYCVIGTRGFPAGLSRSADYDAYRKSIDTAAKNFPSKAKFDKVQPFPSKWTE
jgi:hypothetical protein